MRNSKNKKAFVSILALFFLVIFSSLSVSFISATSMNKRMSENHQSMSVAQVAAENGMQYIRTLAGRWSAPATCYTGKNYVTDDEARTAFASFSDHIGVTLNNSYVLFGNITSSTDIDNEYTNIPNLKLTNATNANVNITCNLIMPKDEDGNPIPLPQGMFHQIEVVSEGTSNGVTRRVKTYFDICKSNEVLEYAIASHGRIWLTGDSTIDGDLYSAWDNIACSPFNVTSDSAVKGTINTVFTKEQAMAASWQMETLDAEGDIIYDEDGNPVVSSWDQIQGSHEGIKYGRNSDVPGMNINDYNTDEYLSGLTNLSNSSETRIEYFPHAAGSYSTPSSSSSRKLYRKVYRNQHFTNVRLPDNYNALFVNCTFDETFYIDCNKSASSYYNNVRFEDCTFNGTIITDVPQYLKWKENCLYFTGSATFNNTSSIEEATILAPHFNVNLGNANPIAGDENTLKGAIVGGIVDVRGNANVYGTIISMCDTTKWTSGYVTNIGVTLDDGGSESTEPGDIGIINVTPDKKNMLPSGITSPIVIKPDFNTYTEQ